jgi:hypothetical protein
MARVVHVSDGDTVTVVMEQTGEIVCVRLLSASKSSCCMRVQSSRLMTDRNAPLRARF